jgi:hypothetical protein
VVSATTRVVRSNFASLALASSASLHPSTVAVPQRVVSFISVVGCGSRPSSPIRQNRRHVIESATSRHRDVGLTGSGTSAGSSPTGAARRGHRLWLHHDKWRPIAPTAVRILTPACPFGACSAEFRTVVRGPQTTHFAIEGAAP